MTGRARSLATIVGGVLILALVGVGLWHLYSRMSFKRLQQRATALVENGEYLEATRVLEQIVREEGETEWSLDLLSRSFFGLGDYSQASHYVDTLTERFPANVSGHVMRGEIHFQHREYTEALRSFQTAADIDPEENDALIGRGKCAFRLGLANPKERTTRFQEADNNLREAQRREPDSADANRWLAALLLEEGRTDPGRLAEALTYAQKSASQNPRDDQALRVLGGVQLLMGDLEAAETSLTKAHEIERRDPRIHHDLGVVLFRRRNLAKAREHLENAVKQEQAKAAKEQENLAQYLTDYASCLAMLDDWQGAKEALQQAVEADAEDLEPRLRLALSAYHDKDEKAALDNLREAAKRADTSAALHFELGSIAYQTAANEEALDHYERAVRFDPNNPLARFNLGTMYLSLANFTGAEDELSRAVQLAANTDRRLLLDAKLNLGMVYFNSQRPQKATDQFAEVLELDSDNVWGHINYGIGLARQGNAAEAMEHFQRAIQLNPDAFEAHLNLGLLYSSQGRFDEALATLRRALQLAPWEPDQERVHMSLGLVYYQSGQLKEAQEEFRTVQTSRASSTVQRAKNGLACVALQQRDLQTARSLLTDILASPDATDRELVLVNQAIAFAMGGDADAAVASLEQALAQAPQLALAYYNRGVLRYESGVYDHTTLSDFQRAYREDPRMAHAHYNLALTFAKQGELERAEQEYLKALSVNERYVAALINLALLRVRGGQDATDLLNRAIEVSPEEPRVPLVRAYQALLAEDPGLAIEQARLALGKDNSLQQAYSLLGYVYLVRDQWGEAQTALERAIELDPQDATARLNYGRLLHLQGQMTEAETQIARARDLDPNRVEIYRALVALYLDMWLYEEAQEAIRVAFELSPNDEQLIALENEIMSLMTRGGETAVGVSRADEAPAP